MTAGDIATKAELGKKLLERIAQTVWRFPDPDDTISPRELGVKANVRDVTVSPEEDRKVERLLITKRAREGVIS